MTLEYTCEQPDFDPNAPVEWAKVESIPCSEVHYVKCSQNGYAYKTKFRFRHLADHECARLLALK